MSSIVISNFEAERFFISGNESQLPTILTIYSRNNICSLDEMQFVFAGSGHHLATQLKISDIFKEYLQEIGFEFKNLYAFDSLDAFRSRNSDNIFDNLHPNGFSLNGITDISNESFAFEEKTFDFAHAYNLLYTAPDYPVIKKANSKIFSAQLAGSLFDQDSYIIRSSEELSEYGQKKLLTNSSIIIKSEFGVSGKGSVKIDTPSQLESIVRYIKRQENKGCKTAFVVEKFLDKKTDFSAIAWIDRDFSFQILSMQKMRNVENSFNSIIPLDQGTRQLLDEKGYEESIGKILAGLGDIGYFGPVCIDSMVLTNDEIIPLVEINARKSMSFLNNALLKKYEYIDDLKCIVSLKKLLIPRGFDLCDFMGNMRKNQILFFPGNSSGIIPLNSNSLIINSGLDNDLCYQANLYIAFLFRNNHEIEQIENGIYRYLNDSNIKLRQ